MAIQVIPNWKKAWKFASVQWSVLGLMLITVQESTGDLWNKLPAEVQATIPYSGYIPAALIALSIVGRLLVFTGKTTNGDEQP